MKDFEIYYGKDICHICQKPSYIKIRYKTRDSRLRNTIHFVSLCNDCANMIENEWREKFHKEIGEQEWLKELQAHREAWENVKSELWMEGMNMTGEYQGVWVRYRDIERVIDANRPKEGDAE